MTKNQLKYYIKELERQMDWLLHDSNIEKWDEIAEIKSKRSSELYKLEQQEEINAMIKRMA